MSQGRKRCQAACKKTRGQYHPVISSIKQVHTWAHTHAQTQSLSIWNVRLTRCMLRTAPALRPLVRRTTITFDSHTHALAQTEALMCTWWMVISITKTEGLNLFHREIKKTLVNTRGPMLVISCPNMSMHQSKRGQHFISLFIILWSPSYHYYYSIIYMC